MEIIRNLQVVSPQLLIGKGVRLHDQIELTIKADLLIIEVLLRIDQDPILVLKKY